MTPGGDSLRRRLVGEVADTGAEGLGIDALQAFGLVLIGEEALSLAGDDGVEQPELAEESSRRGDATSAPLLMTEMVLSDRCFVLANVSTIVPLTSVEFCQLTHPWVVHA
jgi:hypothetical protein